MTKLTSELQNLLRKKRTEHLNPSLVEEWLPTADSLETALKIVTHETLHELVNNHLGIPNTAFTEALFDFLCGRGHTGLWFAKECFEQIYNRLQNPYVTQVSSTQHPTFKGSFYEEFCSKCTHELTCKFKLEMCSCQAASGCRFYKQKKEVIIHE